LGFDVGSHFHRSSSLLPSPLATLTAAATVAGAATANIKRVGFRQHTNSRLREDPGAVSVNLDAINAERGAKSCREVVIASRQM
jgi:hypothetical protein